MVTRVLNAIILGPPGCGKKLISSWIIRDFGMSYLSYGKILKGFQTQADTEKIAETKMFEELKIRKGKNLLIDGFPKTLLQAQNLSTNIDVDTVLYLDVPHKEILERRAQRRIHKASGRVYYLDFKPPKLTGIDDITGEPIILDEKDKPEVFQNRLLDFDNQMRSILQFYRDAKLLQKFNGTKSNQIYPKIQAYLSKF